MNTQPKSKRWPGPLRRRVANPRNSVCSTAKLADLDWQNWFADEGYIHVRRSRSDLDGVGDETWHRVFARIPANLPKDTRPRLACRNGQLFWLIDRPNL
jgi:hypothetical protein